MRNPKTGAPQRQCMGNKARGGRCTRYIDEPRQFCERHDPDRAEERRANAAAAVTLRHARDRRRKKRNPPAVSLNSAAEIQAFQAQLAAKLSSRPTEHEIAIVNAGTRLVTAATSTLRVAELERQVDELRAQLARALGEQTEGDE